MYAADGAAGHLLAEGLVPHVTIGDLDSLASELCEQLPLVIGSEDQDTTDAQKLLAQLKGDGFDAVLLCRLEGDRMDHVMASLSAAVACDLSVGIALRDGLGLVVRGGSEGKRFRAWAGQRVSLMPLTDCLGVTITGVRWPLANASLSVGGAISVSNEATGNEVGVCIGSGTALLILSDGVLKWPDEVLVP